MPRRFTIKKNHGCESPSHIIAVDCFAEQPKDDNGERILTAPWEVHFIYAIAARRKKDQWYGRAERSFTDPLQLWEWIRERSRKREPIYLFGYNWHFLAQALGMWEEIDTGKFALSIPERERLDGKGKAVKVKRWDGMVAVDDRPFAVFMVHPGGTVKVLDALNYFDVDMQTLAESVGRTCEPIGSGDANDVQPEIVAESRASTTFAIMQRTLDSWRSANRGNWQPTAARLAMSNFRHEFMPTQGIVIDNDKMDREFHRKAYYGGTVRHWYRGRYDATVYKVDVSAMYPASMLSGMFPVRVGYDSGTSGVLASIRPVRPEHCLADITVLGKGDLPLRRKDNSLDYPQGEFRTCLCGDELASADESGRIVAWHRHVSFDTAPAFRRYVVYWWSIRQQAKATGDQALDALSKLMLNSLYGKFAARKQKWETVKGMCPPKSWGFFLSFNGQDRKIIKMRAVAGLAQRPEKQEEREDTFPAISAFITAAGRVFMRTIRELLGCYNVLAQQTDSFLLTQVGYNRLRKSEFWGPGEIGKFRLVDTYDYVDIKDANHYKTNKSECLAGVPDDRRAVGQWEWETVRPVTTPGLVAMGGPTGHVQSVVGKFAMGVDRDPRAFDSAGWQLGMSAE